MKFLNRFLNKLQQYFVATIIDFTNRIYKTIALMLISFFIVLLYPTTVIAIFSILLLIAVLRLILRWAYMKASRGLKPMELFFSTIILITATVGLFGNIYFLVFKMSRYSKQFYSFANDTKVGYSVDRIFAKYFVETKLAGENKFYQYSNPEIPLHQDTTFVSHIRWLIQFELTLPGAEVSVKPDPQKLRTLIRELAFEQENLMNYSSSAFAHEASSTIGKVETMTSSIMDNPFTDQSTDDHTKVELATLTKVHCTDASRAFL